MITCREAAAVRAADCERATVEAYGERVVQRGDGSKTVYAVALHGEN